MKKMGGLVAVLVVMAAGCGVTHTAQPRPVTHRATLQQDTEIQGYPCAKGYAWFYADGKLRDCTVSQETKYGEALIPRRSIINLNPNGSLWGGQLAHNTRIHDVLCDGGGILGPAEGASAAFYPSGKLKQCWLAGDQVVQGVPCMTAGFIGLFGDGARRDGGAKFYESGKLESCTLGKDFGGKRRGEHFQQGQ